MAMQPDETKPTIVLVHGAWTTPAVRSLVWPSLRFPRNRVEG
jgi:hypothetical protein